LTNSKRFVLFLTSKTKASFLRIEATLAQAYSQARLG